MGLPKLKHLQLYMTSFEQYFRWFERPQQSNQLYDIFLPSMEYIFYNLKTADIEINTSHSMIELIVNRNFVDTFHHNNVPNQHQRTNQNVGQRYQHSNTRQQYQNINTVQ